MAALARRARTLGDLLGSGAGRYARLDDHGPDARQPRGAARRRVLRACAARASTDSRTRGQRSSAALPIVLYEPDPGRRRAAAAEPRRAELESAARRARARVLRGGREPTIVGVTGTNGKTTVAYLLAQVLSRPQAPVRVRRHVGLRRAAGDHGARFDDAGLPHAAPRARGARRAARRDGSLVARAEAGPRRRPRRSTRPCSRISRAIISTSTATSRATATRSAGCSRCRGSQYAVLNADDPFAATIAAALGARLHARCARACAARPSSCRRGSGARTWTELELDVCGQVRRRAPRVEAHRRVQRRESARRRSARCSRKACRCRRRARRSARRSRRRAAWKCSAGRRTGRGSSSTTRTRPTRCSAC